MPPDRRLAALLATLTCGAIAASCGAERGARSVPRPTAVARRPASSSGLPLLGVGGLRAGAARADVLAAHPELVPATDPHGGGAMATATTELAGVPAQVSLYFHDDRLYSIALSVSGAAASEATYRRLAAHLRGEVGPGHATRCASERPPGEPALPIEQDITQGIGLLAVDWREGPLYGHLSLSRGYAPAAPLSLTGFLTAVALRPPCDPDEGLVCGTGEARRAPPVAQGMAGASGNVSLALLAFPVSTCSVLPPGAPSASLLGLGFGATRSQVELGLGHPLEELRGGVGATAATVAGVPGQLVAHFYEGCLAVLQFIVRGPEATLGAYEALRASVRPTLGRGQASRCLSEDRLEEEEYIELGLGRRTTRWRGEAPLTGEIRIEQSPDREGPAPHIQIVLEAEYEPLRAHAPHIDFD